MTIKTTEIVFDRVDPGILTAESVILLENDKFFVQFVC